MTDNVIILDAPTRLDIPAERVLQAALNHGLESVVISGYDRNGNEYFASSLADGADALWIIKRLETVLLNT